MSDDLEWVEQLRRQRRELPLSYIGPGDPVHYGRPWPQVIQWLLSHTNSMGSTRYWNDRGTWRRLEFAEDFAALNRALDGVRASAVL